MVLCAGLGTRLRPLSEMRAKALVPVGDRAALAHVLERLAKAGVERVAVNVHHRADEMRTWLAANAPRAGVSEEAELLGTAGGVARARSLLGAAGGVLVWNGDILADIDVRALLAAASASASASESASASASNSASSSASSSASASASASASSSASASASASPDTEALLVVRPLPRGEGNVGVDDEGRVVRLRQERIASEARGGEFLGVHWLGERLRAALPERGCLVGDVYIPAMRRGVLLRAFTHERTFFDVGSPRGYLDANLAWLASRGVDRWVGEGARVEEGVALGRVVVGAGAVVEGRGAVDRCVVWPASRARAPLAHAVVAGDRVVSVPAPPT
jgi:mannose-1-phosphate guanylyltransferase